MQRAQKEAERAANELGNDDYDETFDSAVCSKLKNRQKCIINPSYQFCERLRFGRFSFKGMNQDIETIMYNNESEQNTSSEKRTAEELDEDED